MFYSHHTLLKNARFLIGLAWAVEIIAVLIGLTISIVVAVSAYSCLLYTSPSPRDAHESRMPSSA